MTVEILLATYNGEPFLAEQLDSLRAQTWSDWQLQVRDDGSQDGTLTILKHYCGLDPRIVLVEPDGRRLGACGSFAELLQRSRADYLMFCDQDDRWWPQKIATTLEAMRTAERTRSRCPVLVHSDLAVVDAQMRPLSPSFWKYQSLDPHRARLQHLLVQNVVTGCATMINAPLRALALPIPVAAAVMHDWWLALVAAAFGQIASIERPLVDYRQHQRNRLGAKRFSAAYIVDRLGAIAEIRRSLLDTQRQAQAFLERYAERLDPATRILVADYADLARHNLLNRKVKILKHRYFKHNLARTLGMLLLG
ncbi:glycosyltransferase family 2 protein [Gloeobacter morelensis]|uniref:Glycosyltransferase family 2 protein n=1 Tax=Gloeobacter morelensis MG652769 TaxID=2781736 RepID=A0ABY3PQP0_9CYAN|nr:glycosyltransferase family 2 protein [Gloeobacter morelensis]UFP95970.1 glycosyltransferase family 2 protein [Gloeobacter morelensis MG652769]